MPTYIPFVRVSTKQQEVERQLADITRYAEQHHLPLAAPITEVVSGGKRNTERPAIQQLMRTARRGDTVIVTEVSRLGRRTSEVLTTIEDLADRGVSVFVLNHLLATLKSDGSRNSMVFTMLTMGAEFARLERETLRERVQSGVDHARSQGRIGGRPAGAVKTDEKLLDQYAGVVKRLKAGTPIRDIATLEKVSPRTVQKVKKAWKAQGQ